MSTYLDLPFTASLVVLLILSRLSIWLDLQLWCQAKGFKSNSVGIFWKLRSCLNITFFLPEGLSEAFIGCTNLLILRSCFRQENIYPIQCVMQCMIMNDVSEYFKLVFSFEFVLSLCFRILCFSSFFCFLLFFFFRPCVPYRLACLVYHASILSLKSIFTLDVFLSCHNFLGVRIVILWFNCRRYTRLTSIFLCWVLTNWFPHCQ